VRTIGDVALLDDAACYRIFGRGGTFYRDLARGIDEREVDPSRERKSISSEETFEYDVRDEARILALLREQCDELSEGLKKRDMRAQTVGIKVKRSDFTVTGKQTTLTVPTNDPGEIFAAAEWCWHRSGLQGVPSASSVLASPRSRSAKNAKCGCSKWTQRHDRSRRARKLRVKAAAGAGHEAVVTDSGS